MQLKHLRTILAPVEGLSKVTAVCWSANSRKFAAVTADRVVHLFDDNGERRDKFSTKPADAKGPKNYLVRGMAFSPDSSKLAIAQSDNIVFVYKIGAEWGDKKSICNKFPQNSAVTSLTWPVQHPNEVVFGLAEGKVKIGQLRTNKPATLYSTDSYVVCLCNGPDGNSILSGHVDGSIYRFIFEDGQSGPSQAKLVLHQSIPYALAWGESVIAAGNDCKVTIYDRDGLLLQTFDYSHDEAQKEFTAATCNPSGECAVVGSFNRMHVFSYNARKGAWEESGVKDVENLYTVSALSWKPDGSRLAVGNLTGAIDLYDACIRRYRYRGKFEFTYVSLSQVIVKRLSSGVRIVLKSHFGYEITKINIYRDQYLVANTPETLLMGDLDTCKLSEIPWSGSGQEKFFFDNVQVCMIFNAGELTLVEYGRNEILGSCRTEHMNPHLISVRLNERVKASPPGGPKPAAGEGGEGAEDGGSPTAAASASGAGPDGDVVIEEENKKIAYLIDLHTIRILDLVSGVTVATINHDTKIDWLELNMGASKLLFRDKRRQLHLYDLATQTRSTLLNYCSYVQWVPGADVVVAQNRGNLCVWYSIDAPERVTIFPIKGDVEDIERSKGRTEVVVDEGINTVSYALDESLIEFGSALEKKNYERAVDLLEQLELTPETEAMWSNLSQLALRDMKLHIAERCFAALLDVSKARYLHKVNQIADYAAGELGYGDGTNHFMVRAKLALLSKQFKAAEGVLLEQGQVEEAMEMYQEMHRWDEAIAVAESKNHPEAKNLRNNYYHWLLETNQEEKAGQLKEKEEDYMTAIDLYLKGGLPGRAAAVIYNHPQQYSSDTLETIAASLVKAGMFDKAGDFFERLNKYDRAIEAYRRGNSYRRAVELARRMFPDQVVSLEESWGDWLVSQKQVDAAVNHYIEAGQSKKAIEAAITARRFTQAVQIIDSLDVETAKPYFKRIAKYFEEAKQLKEAEKYYLKAGLPQEAVDMYTKNNMWEAAHAVAITYMSDSEVASLYISQAQRLEAQGRFKEAEKLYLTVKEPDLAINMYKKNRQYEQMVRLVATHRKELLGETHLHLAQQLESEGNFKEAERHYVEAKDWQSAVNMYRSNDLWDDAIRVAKLHGGVNASKKVAYAWAVSLGGEAGAKLLTKFGLIEQAIEYAMETGAFAHAFELARASLKAKLPEVHLKYAMFLEDEGRFKEAEEEFISATKPKEAIDMYIHQQDWPSAMRVAELNDPPSVADVLVAQARVAIERKEYQRAEALFIKARKYDLAIKMYKDLRMWPDAIRVTKEYMPHRLPDITAEHIRFAAGSGDDQAAKLWEESGEYSRAIDIYLRMTKEQTADLDYLEEKWENAVKLAMNHVPERIPEVVNIVSKRLIDIKRYEQAAELLESIDSHKEAIDVYMMGGMWDKARALAANNLPQYAEYVEKNYVQHLLKNEKADALVETGNVAAALDLYASRGEWQKVFEVADQQGQETIEKYAVMYATRLMEESKYAESVRVFVKYGASDNPANFTLYKKLAREVLAHPIADDIVQELRDMLYKLVNDLKGDSDIHPATKQFERLLLITHYTALKNFCKERGMPDIACKLAVSLLRYCGEIPADKAFFEAGTSCRELGQLNMAFVFLNRYLDLSEAMEDADGGGRIENADFEKTDIPYDFPLPEKQYLSEEKREEVRDWVLQLSMDQRVEQVLSTRPCDKCGSDLYEASLSCWNCKFEYTPCIVTGYPIPRNSRADCKHCGKDSNRDDWNRYLLKFKNCPFCQDAQAPQY
mmetsp:Transcript_15284/g.25210  ORF Transcript_15284/g.25210 Transcript_15284/m.25210 type:complete len:1767 (+) Transcript_15284:218-5518(+)|eukprot:CAMPEP_0184651320 /NCGR_PEP_ID=MMETSP0308-20130426/8906_1 /TAXON_ID=38269 /ORGANISM="Gloeochaete witrockiana, Strain SAG 46.84" /LENGTH=1766 /DNA_ID=CAMNT_0027085447 /DNA_START=124 /DNA_END=5424 /DNA_ORIENTATION=+